MTKVVLSNTLITNNSLSVFQYEKLLQELISLQKRIYKATLCHNYKSVHQLQKLLLKSKSAKLIIFLRLVNSYSNVDQLLIKNSITKISSNSYYYISRYYQLYNLAKRQNLVKSLNCLTDQVAISNLSHKLESDLIYLCLKPEWEAKFITNSLAKNNQFNVEHKIKAILKLCSEYNKNLYSKSNKIYVIKNNVDTIKSLNILSYHYLQGKLNTTSTINKFIQRYLMLNFTKNFGDQQTEHISVLQLDLLSPLLFYLLRKIVMESLDFEICLRNQSFISARHKNTINAIFNRFIYHNGYFTFFSRNKSEIVLIRTQIIKFFNNLGIKFEFKDVKILDLNQGFTFLGFYLRRNFPFTENKFGNIIIQPSVRSKLALLRKVKSVLYHKDYLHRVRPNTYMSFRLATKKVNHVVQKWTSYYQPYIVCTTTYKQFSTTLQIILYKWQIKKYQRKPRLKVGKNLYIRLNLNNLLMNW